MKIAGLSVVVLAIELCLPIRLFADYTIVLEDDRRITVKEYWAEGEMLEFPGLGGRVAIRRSQIQAIIQAGETEPQGVVVADMEKGPFPFPSTAFNGTPAKVPPPTEVRRFEVGDKKQEENQELYKNIPVQFQAATELRWLMTKQTTHPDPTLVPMQGLIEDTNSRRKDSLYNPARSRGTGIVNLEVNSPFAGRRMRLGLRHGGVVVPGRVHARTFDPARPGRVDFPERVTHFRQRVDVPLPEYSYREKELSELRGQLIELYDERLRLIQEMKDKGIFTGSLPWVPRKFLE